MSGPGIVWEVLPDGYDDRPFYGPPCPGYEIHGWTLYVEDGDVWLHSGCAECDWAIETHEVAVQLRGRLRFEADHLPLGGWHGDVRCDCNYWYRFTPEAGS